ncbi:MAG: hypothetical protein HY907_07205 [Deltaproteobacteria bacterium]|nr:hypothetical protein [Deltaproteobacteria bacterium]
MDASFQRLSLLTQTAYARLLDQLGASTVGELASGTSLVSKSIRGHRYWYAQTRVGGRKIQRYVGPDSEETNRLVERWRRSRAEATSRAELVAMARAGGAYVVPAAEARVLGRLAAVFRMGGVLVGSHAFAVLGNSLGVRWREAMVRTGDVDVATDARIGLAVSRETRPLDLDALLGDPIPRVPILHPTYPATSFSIRGTSIEVDLLTPLVGRERSRPISIPGLGVAATPLRFLDYLIEETQPGAVLGGEGVLVNVPRPGRFALHKLIVASRQRVAGGSPTKSRKDVEQANALIRVLAEDLPGELSLAWKALAGRGPAWRAAVASTLRRLDPEVVEILRARGVP